MGDVNWNLGLAQTNPGEQFANAFAHGQQMQQQRAQQNALAALAMNPNDPQAQQGAAQYAPQAVMQARQLSQQDALQQLEAHRENIIKGAQLIRQMKPQDDASWQQMLVMAQQAGIDVSEVPQHFDPQYVQGVVQLADTFAPQPAQHQQLVPFVPGGGVAAIGPDGQPHVMIMPNQGGAQTGAPVSGNIPHVTDQASYDAVPPGGQYVTPDGHTRIKGGQSGSVPAGGFPF